MDIGAWNEIHGEKSKETLQVFFESRTDSYAVLQLKVTDETAPDRYMEYDWLQDHNREPEIDHYDVVYTARLPSGLQTDRLLEDIYLRLNLFHPEDYAGHSLSVSDIVALKQAGVITCHYVDSIGFRQLPDFMPENYLRNAEMQLEDDYSMLDGCINNGKKETVQDERPSVLEQLKNAQEREKLPAPPKHREEREIE